MVRRSRSYAAESRDYSSSHQRRQLRAYSHYLQSGRRTRGSLVRHVRACIGGPAGHVRHFAVLLLVRGSLRPFEGLKRGLSDLEAGKSNVRIEARGATEFRLISAALNSLAATLDRVRTENRALVDRLIRVQDDERKEIARDLHDEAGPCLFSIRAGAVALSEFTANATLDIPQIRQTCANVNKASEVLQNLFRALLGQLAPRGLSEFGLREVLKGLLNSWRTSRPDVALELICPHDLSILEEPISLTAFRVVRSRSPISSGMRTRIGRGSPSSSFDRSFFVQRN